MAAISYSQNIVTHVDVARNEVSGATVREVLEHEFTSNPRLQSYLLNDDGTPRKHVAIFLNGSPILDRKDLSDPVSEDSEIFVMQALSGG